MEKTREEVSRRVLARLSFIKEDLNAIERIKIEDEGIKDLIVGIKSRVELLFGNLKSGGNNQNRICY
jgi:archaellum component FlaC